MAEVKLNETDAELLTNGTSNTGKKGPAFGALYVQVAVAALGLGITYPHRDMFSISIIAMTDNTTSTLANVPLVGNYLNRTHMQIFTAILLSIVLVPQRGLTFSSGATILRDTVVAILQGPAFGARYVQVAISAMGLGITFAHRDMFSISVIAMTDNTTSTIANVPVYDWKNKSVILSAIFWGGICLPLVSGYLGKQYGPKWFLLGAGITENLFYMLIPFAAKYLGSTGVIICRIIEGFAQGMILPLNTCILGNWVPTEERSRMGFFGTAAITTSLTVVSLGSGYISESFLGWPWIFYIFGGIGLIWCTLVALLAEQNPHKHPRITPEERKYIQTSLDQKIGKEIPTPWKKIFTSIHFWAILVAQCGFVLNGLIVSTESSIFMNKIMKFGVKTSGIVLAIPPLCALVGGLPLSFLSDFIPRRRILSVLNCRRLFHSVGTVTFSACICIMTYIPPEHAVWAVVSLCMAYVFLIGSIVGGSDVNALDISPMFAGLMFGCYSTVSQSLSLVAPFMVQLIITDESDATQWHTLFLISGAIVVASVIFFDIFASATRQNWDGENEKEANISKARRRSSLFREQ